MASNLECVGLAVDDQAAMDELLRAVGPASRSLGRIHGVDVRRWEDPSGARLVYGVRGGEVTEFLPSFAAAPGAQLANIRFVSDEVASVAVVDDEGEQVTRMTLELEQQRFLQRRGAPTSGRAAITALGVDVAVFDDAEAFRESPASLLGDTGEDPGDPPARYVELGLEWPTRVAAQSFISFGVFASDDEPTAHARLAGTVVAAELRTVVQTGQAFVAARVSTVGFEATVCVPLGGLTAPPRVGNVIHGTVFLVADIDVPLPAAGRRRRLGRATRGPRNRRNTPWR